MMRPSRVLAPCTTFNACAKSTSRMRCFAASTISRLPSLVLCSLHFFSHSMSDDRAIAPSTPLLLPDMTSSISDQGSYSIGSLERLRIEWCQFGTILAIRSMCEKGNGHVGGLSGILCGGPYDSP